MNLAYRAVAVLGQSFVAYAGADARFQIVGVPEGDYELIAPVPPRIDHGQVWIPNTGFRDRWTNVPLPPQPLGSVSVTAGATTMGDFFVPDLESDPSNCGACGNACQPGAACLGGVCGCGPGQVMCSSACTDLSTDNINCGACGIACESGTVCQNGVCVSSCVPKTCLQMGASCGPIGDGCGSILYCGTCDAGMACVGNRCVASACTDNAQCGGDEYCAKFGGACGAQGTCQARPTNCPIVFSPVCGCDGTTYANECEAAAAGVNFVSKGACVS